MPNLDNVYEHLSTATGRSVEEIHSEVSDLMQNEKRTEDVAIVIWQSSHSMELQGFVIKGALFRVLDAGEVREYTSKKDGSKGDVADCMFFALDADQNVRLCTATQWNDAASYVEDLEVGTLYLADVKIKVLDDISLAEIKTPPSPVEDKGQMKSNIELLNEFDPISISALDDHVDKVVLCRGIVGSDVVAKTKNGYDFWVFQVSMPDADPISVFTNVAPNCDKGDLIALLGMVKVGKQGGLIVAGGSGVNVKVFKL